jgi:hypothetical protein
VTKLVSDDDSAGSLKSRVSFTAVAGSEYRFVVDGYAAASGSITLRWNQP